MRLRLTTGSALLCLLAHGDPAVAGTTQASVPAAVAVTSAAPDLQALHAAAGTATLWAGGGVAAERRAVLAALLSREAARGVGAAVDPALLQRLAGADDAERRAGERVLDAAFLAYLGRRQGGETAAMPSRIQAAMRMLERPLPEDPLALAQLELGIVEALGGWVRVETYLPEAVAPASPAELRLVAFINGGPPQAAPGLARPVPVETGLRARLIQSGDLAATSAEAPEAAVRRFQERNGLNPDGVVGAQTLAALNAPVSAQIRQVALNRQRLAQLQGRSLRDRHVVVNVPAYHLQVWDEGRITLASRVIVGDEETPTPIFDDMIRYIELNPSWYVPPSIVEELQGKEFRKADYFEKNGFEWRGGGDTGKPLRLVQRPGPANALGQMKFLFPNHHAVYIHDTARRGLFARSERSLSHGCIRVENPMALALALAGDEGWDQPRIEAVLASGKTRRLALQRPVPVYLDYVTAFVDERGALQLRPDLYGFDRDGIAMFEGKRGFVAAAPAGPAEPAPPTARPEPDAVEATARPAVRAETEPPASVN